MLQDDLQGDIVMKRIRSLKEHMMLPFGVAVAVGIAAAAVILLIASLIMFVLQLPAELGYVMGLSALAVGCAAAGYMLGKMKCRSGIKQGVLCGSALFLLCLAVGVILGSVTVSGVFAKLGICLCAGIVGGVAGVNRG